MPVPFLIVYRHDYPGVEIIVFYGRLILDGLLYFLKIREQDKSALEKHLILAVMDLQWSVWVPLEIQILCRIFTESLDSSPGALKVLMAVSNWTSLF